MALGSGMGSPHPLGPAFWAPPRLPEIVTAPPCSREGLKSIREGHLDSTRTVPDGGLSRPFPSLLRYLRISSLLDSILRGRSTQEQFAIFSKSTFVSLALRKNLAQRTRT